MNELIEHLIDQIKWLVEPLFFLSRIEIIRSALVTFKLSQHKFVNTPSSNPNTI